MSQLEIRNTFVTKDICTMACVGLKCLMEGGAEVAFFLWVLLLLLHFSAENRESKTLNWHMEEEIGVLRSLLL